MDSTTSEDKKHGFMDTQNCLSTQFGELSHCGRLIFGSPAHQHFSCPEHRGQRFFHPRKFPQRPAGSRGFRWPARRRCGSRGGSRARQAACPACSLSSYLFSTCFLFFFKLTGKQEFACEIRGRLTWLSAQWAFPSPPLSPGKLDLTFAPDAQATWLTPEIFQVLGQSAHWIIPGSPGEGGKC